MADRPVRFAVDAGYAVSGLLDLPADAHPCWGGAPRAPPPAAPPPAPPPPPPRGGGGAGPDAPKLAHATVRAAVAEAARLAPGLPLFAGGKSFGGRMTSQAEATAPLPGVHGLIFLGFPLHPAAKPSDERAAHLAGVRVPMLFLQGTRDALAELGLLRPVVERLGGLATLAVVEDGDHSFHVRKASGRDDAAVVGELVGTIAGWIDEVA